MSWSRHVGLRVIWVRQIRGQRIAREIERIVGRWTHIRETVTRERTIAAFVLDGNGRLKRYRTIQDAVYEVLPRRRSANKRMSPRSRGRATVVGLVSHRADAPSVGRSTASSGALNAENSAGAVSERVNVVAGAPRARIELQGTYARER